MAHESTFFALKPDARQRDLVGEILSRIEAEGLTIEEIKSLEPTREQLAEHYREHVEKDFYQGLVE